MVKANILLLSFFICLASYSQTAPEDAERGLRADWMRGALGMLWLPENTYGGNIEGKRIDDFLNQINHLRIVDFIQIGLASPYIYSPVHTAPHDVIESLWEGDMDENGKPINLVVPRAEVDDPFLSWLLAIRAAGLKAEVYVNTCNLLTWPTANAPASFPDISERWKAYCDANYQEFITSKSYHTNGTHDDRRPYMFCYTEYILKEYAIRYGDLIDAWCFDAAHTNMGAAGDNKTSGSVDDQRIFEAFANACHAGNPNAAVTFNTGVGERDSDPFEPYASPTYFEDYKFGHPFGGAGNMVEPRDPLYEVNFGVCEYMKETGGDAFRDDNIDWNDNIVAHFFPKQSTTSWNDGGTPCLTDEEFVEWNNTGLINGGGITWGTPLKVTNLNNVNHNLILQEYALQQFEAVEADLSVNQYPGAPNWARSYTILKDATIGQAYADTLIEGFDFWDPEGDAITALFAVDDGSAPEWLTITEAEPGVWVLSGTPTESFPVDYEFNLRAEDASGGRERLVELKVEKEEIQTEFTATALVQATASTNYGIDQTASMISDVQTAPDGLATYQIAVTVTPSDGKAIVSGNSNGSSTTKSFGIGTSISDNIFKGSDGDWIENIGNIEIINFEPNGGMLTKENIINTSFQSLIIVNAQSTNDNVSFLIDGTTITYGKTPAITTEINLTQHLGQEVNEFSIGTGNTSTTNKWSIDGLNIKVNFYIPSTQTIELKAGWNLVSLYIEPDNHLTGTVFPNASIVKTFDTFYLKSQDGFLNTLTEIEAGVGYLVYNEVDETITVYGIISTQPLPALMEGWNLIGVPAPVSVPASSLEDAQIIKDFDSFYQKGNAVNTLIDLKPGRAYFAK